MSDTVNPYLIGLVNPKKCKICNTQIIGPRWYIKNLKYCSNKCVGIRNRGKNNPMHRPEVKKKVAEKISIWSKEKWKDNSFREKQRLAHLGKKYKNSGQFKKGQKPWHNGKKTPKLGGENCHFWMGGKTEISQKIRTSLEYRLWRKSVFERDNYICQICNQRGGKLNADHIKAFAQYPQLRFDISNGRTLCYKCHIQTDNYGRKGGIKKYGFNRSNQPCRQLLN